MVARQLLLWTVGSAVCAVSSASYSWVGQLQAPLQRQRQRQQQQQQQQQRRRQQRSSVVVAQETLEKKKVVITGLGTLTSLGNDVDTFFDNLLEGKCGIGPVTNFDAENSAVKIASEVTGFEIGELWEPKDAKRYDRYTHLALGAAYGALADGGMKMEEIDPFRFGVLIGSSCGGITAVENSCRILFEKGPKRITPFLLPSIIGNTAGSMVAIQLGCKGPNYGIVSSCATANHAIGEALKCLQLGDADIMLAGGTEAAVTSLGVAGFSSMHEMCTTSNDAPQKASRPFDTDRSGFVMGEGAGVLLMETEEHAKARGAKIYCELAGYAANCEAYNVVGGPTPEGAAMADCMSLAMSQAGVSAGDVDYVNAHGTSVAHDDKVEV